MISRILVVETQSHPGGLWHYACCLSRALGAAGFDVVLAATTPFEVLEGFAAVKVRSIGAHVRPMRFRPLSLIRRAINQVKKFLQLRRLVLDFRPHVVHLNTPTGKLDFLYFRYLRALGARVVFTVHEPDPDTGVDWFDWARCRAADAIFVHSQKSFQAVKAGGIDESKIARIHHGTYLDICPDGAMANDEAKRALGVDSGAQIILFFGAIAPYKGLDILIRAFAQLAKEVQNAYLVIAGLPQEDFATYQREIDASGAGQRIVLNLRYIPFAEFPKYFGAADVVAFPYRRVQQSGVLQLAYAYGRPVVTTNVGGLGEEVTEDRTGMVVPVADAHALAVALRDVLADGAGTEDMGKRGRRLAETKYSWASVVEKTAEVYRSICESKGERKSLPDPAP